MKNLVNPGVGHRNVRSWAKSLLAAGAASALILTGLAFVAAEPVSASPNVVFSGATTAQANAAFSVTVTTTGSGENVTLASSCPFVAGTTNVTTNGSDQAVFSGMQIDVGTSCTLTATVTSGVDINDSSTEGFTLTPAAASKLVFTTAPPTAITSGASFQTKVSIEDQYGNVETGLSDMLSVTSSTAGCAVGGSDGNIAAVNGVTTFNISITAASAVSCTLTATDTQGGDTGLTAATSSAVSVATDTPSKLGFTTQPFSPVVAGANLASFAVTVEESNGIAFTSGVGATDSITVTSSCTLSGTTTVAAVAGVATFTLVSIKTGASCTLIATDATRTLVTATSNAVTVLPGAAAKVAFTTPPPLTVTTAGTAITAFKVSIEDANSNVLTSGTGATDTIAITSPCALGGTTSATAIGGVATFSALTVDVTGACALTATDSTRTLTTAAATTTVGTPQPALTVTSLKGLVGTALKIKTSGGAGGGALTLTTTTGTAGCTVVGGTIKAKKAGTCSVTATMAGTTTYIAVSSTATTITFALPFKVTRVAGTIYAGRTQTVTLIGSGFSGRPRIITNAGGVSARVTGDTGKTLHVVVTASAAAKTGTHTMTVILANGKRTSVKFSLR